MMPWQQFVADVALELDDDGSFRFSEVVIVVPRQSGKTVTVLSKSVWRMAVYAQAFGPQTSTYTAQKRQDARRRFERTFAPVLRVPKVRRYFPEVPHPRVRPSKPNQWRLSLNNGSEAFQFGDSYWQVGGVGESSGHGDTLDDGTIDEARFLTNDDVEAAMSPAQLTRRDAQVWVVSSAGGGQSIYLWRKVLAGRAAHESGNHGRTAYFEWAAVEDADPSDPQVWRGCMPALGITTTEEKIAERWEKAQRGGVEAIDTFKQEYLGIWVDVPVLDTEEAPWCLPKAHWLAGTSEVSTFQAPVSLSLAVAPDRSWSSIGVAGESTVGGIHGACAEYHEGTGWVVDYLKAKCAELGCNVVAPKGSAAMALIPDLERAGVVVEAFTLEQQAQAFGQMIDAVTEGRFKHPRQAHVDVSVREAEVRETEGGALVLSPKRSSVDISPLVAVTLATSKHLQPASAPAPRLEWL